MKTIHTVLGNIAPESLGFEQCHEGRAAFAGIIFRTKAAEESIHLISRKYGDMLVGAGTVVSVEQAKRAVGAGAKFLVSPGFHQKIIEYVVESDIPIPPGCCTPTEILYALEMGIHASHRSSQKKPQPKWLRWR